jgi:hypothetical protein
MGNAPDLGAFERGQPAPAFGPRAAPAAQLAVSPSTTTPGGSATLSWTTSGATQVTISPSIGSVSATGSINVSPSATTTYTLIAEGEGGTAVSTATLTVSSSAGAGTPYGGTPAAVPGTIEAERFNEGGANVAYRDTSAGNSGGAFRNTDVDLEATGDVGGGYNVGWAPPGEWLNYTVNVATAGTYTVDFRVASRDAGGTFHLNVNGTDVTGPLTVPTTGGWQTWTTVTKTGVPLPAGTQVLRLVLDSAPGSNVGNFNWLRFR